MKTIIARIEGISSLLQNRFSEQAEVEGTTRMLNPQRGTPREQATKGVYMDPEGQIYMPGSCISRMLREAGSNHKLKGSRKSVKFAVPSAVIVLDDTISLFHPETETPITEFEVDSRPVVIPATKGRIMRHRPRLDAWAMSFQLEIDDDILPVEFIHQLLSEGGKKLGIGDYRPEKGGPFGRFIVTSWSAKDEKNGHV